MGQWTSGSMDQWTNEWNNENGTERNGDGPASLTSRASALCISSNRVVSVPSLFSTTSRRGSCPIIFTRHSRLFSPFRLSIRRLKLVCFLIPPPVSSSFLNPIPIPCVYSSLRLNPPFKHEYTRVCGACARARTHPCRHALTRTPTPT